jgi:hypothetical protein
MLSFAMLSVAFMCCYAECHYAECCHAECRGTISNKAKTVAPCLAHRH